MGIIARVLHNHKNSDFNHLPKIVISITRQSPFRSNQVEVSKVVLKHNTDAKEWVDWVTCRCNICNIYS